MSETSGYEYWQITLKRGAYGDRVDNYKRRTLTETLLSAAREGRLRRFALSLGEAVLTPAVWPVQHTVDLRSSPADSRLYIRDTAVEGAQESSVLLNYAQWVNVAIGDSMIHDRIPGKSQLHGGWLAGIIVNPSAGTPEALTNLVQMVESMPVEPWQTAYAVH